jgi:hypothetical protein
MPQSAVTPALGHEKRETGLGEQRVSFSDFRRLLETMLPVVRQAHHEDQLVESTRPHPEPVEG